MQVMLLPGLDMSIDHLLPQAMNPLPAIPWDMLIPNGVSLQVVGMVKVGKTLGGSQLLNIANLPAVHYPFVLGIPRQMQCAPFTIAHQDLILDSLHALLKLLATQDTSIGSFVPFSQQLSQEASQDAGHLVSTVAAICMCLLSGRSSLALAGIFGAGKTTSVTFVLMWLALTTPPNVKFTVVSKENPAGQAIAAQVDRMEVPDQAKLLFCRACGATEWDSHDGHHYLIDVVNRDSESGKRISRAKVLVVTTGTAFKAVDHWQSEIADHIGASSIFVHEEAQQAPELLSVSAVAMMRVPCFLLYLGDPNQSPGGIKDTKLAQHLRSELQKLPIGLRAGQVNRTPASLCIALAKTIAVWQNLDPSDAFAHVGDVSEESVFTPWTAAKAGGSGTPLGSPPPSNAADGQTGTPLGSPAHPQGASAKGDEEFIRWVRQVVPECRDINLRTPVGTTLAIALVALTPERVASLQQADSVLACCGLIDGPLGWGLTLSTTSRVPKSVYDALVGTLYPDLMSQDGKEWKFGTGTRNVHRNEPHGFRFLFWRDATRRQRRGRATSRAICAAVDAAFEIFSHIPSFLDTSPGTTPGQLVMTNTKFQRDSLTQSCLEFGFRVQSPILCMSLPL